MSRFNNVFDDDTLGAATWMREFARGGDPTVHGQDESWPAAGVAAFTADKGKSIRVGSGAPSARAGAVGIQRGLARGVTPTAQSGEAGSGKEGGGCACGGNSKSGSAPNAMKRPPSVHEVVKHLKSFLAEIDGPSLSDEMLLRMVQVAADSEGRKRQ